MFKPPATLEELREWIDEIRQSRRENLASPYPLWKQAITYTFFKHRKFPEGMFGPEYDDQFYPKQTELEAAREIRQQQNADPDFLRCLPTAVRPVAGGKILTDGFGNDRFVESSAKVSALILAGRIAILEPGGATHFFSSADYNVWEHSGGIRLINKHTNQSEHFFPHRSNLRDVATRRGMLFVVENQKQEPVTPGAHNDNIDMAETDESILLDDADRHSR